MAAELDPATVDTPSQRSRLNLIEAALDTRANQIKRQYPRDAVGADEVKLLVSGIAGAMLIDGIDNLPATKVAALPLANSNLIRGLIDFGVLERVGSNYRFRFDQYADAERSRMLTLPLRKDFEGPAHRSGDPQLRSTIAMTAERMRCEFGFALWDYSELASDPAPLPLRVGLLIEQARLDEDGYGLRTKDWEDRDTFYGWMQGSAFGQAFRTLYTEESGTVLQLLLQRLDDDRPIIGNPDNDEATVSSLCGGCLCAIERGDVANHISELLANRSPVARSVLRRTLRRYPGTLADYILEFSSHLARNSGIGTDSNKVFLSRLLSEAWQLVPVGEIRPRAIAALRDWTGESESALVRSVAAGVICKIDPNDAAAFDRILALLDADSADEDFKNGVYQLEDVPENHRREVVKRMLARLDALAGRWNIAELNTAWAIFNFLERSDVRAVFAQEITQVLGRHLSRGAEDDRAIARWALRALTDMGPDHLAWNGLFELLDAVLCNADARTEAVFVDHAYCNLPISGDAARRTRRMLAEPATV